MNYKRMFLILGILLLVGLVIEGCGERERLPGIDQNAPIRAFGTCGRCDESWAYVEGHSTRYTEREGCFPLCEDCWSALTPEERLPYYREMWEDWWQGAKREEHIADLNRKWPQIEKAVLQGL